MQFTFEVIRHRMSTTQGEAEVFVNGESIVRYGDDIVLGGQHSDQCAGYGSSKSDAVFIEAAMRQYSHRIVEVV